MSYNVGIIGAARRHQGTGAFIARTFAHYGHKIAGIVGTSKASTSEAKTNLEKNYSIKTQAYTSFEQLANEHALDIVVISTPPSTHLDYLTQALSHQCHVFCEKPLWWPQDLLTHAEYLEKVDQILNLARENQCYIHLNTQWPYTLKDFYRLHPLASAETKPTQFSMHLSPQSSGVSMLVDAASHGLSMLYQMVGSGEIDDIFIEKDGDNAIIQFDYCHQKGTIKSTLGFIRSNETPKPASYQINNNTVKRIVALPQYQIQLQSGQQIMSIQDPLDSSIEDFLAALDAQLETDMTTIRLGASHLHQLIEEFIKS